MSEPQPEYVWVFPPERRRNTGRIWLIIGLSVAAIAIAAVAVWFFFRPGSATTDPSPSPTTSVSASPSPAPSPTAGSTATPTPTPSPGTSSPPSATDGPTPPRPSDPTLAAFRQEVEPVLDSAETGLRYAREDGGMSAMQDVMLLQDDANRLSEKVAPASIASRWSSALSAYSRSLEPLRAAYERGEDASAEDAAASTALARLNDVIGR